MNGENILKNDNQENKIDVIMKFKIKESGKRYVVYTTINGTIEISGLEKINNHYQLRFINSDERNKVLEFYDNIRENISKNNEIDNELMSEDEFYEEILTYLDTALQEIDGAMGEGE